MVSIFTAGFCYDLIKTLKNPIDRYEGRFRSIVVSSAIICFAYIVTESFIYDYLSSTLLREIGIRTKVTYTNKLFAVLVYTIEIYYIVNALFVAFKRLFIRKGLNKEVRQKIIGRQVTFIIVRLIFNMPKEVYIVYEFITDSSKLMDKEEIYIGSVQSFNFVMDSIRLCRGVFYFYLLIGCPDYISTATKNFKGFLSFFRIKHFKEAHSASDKKKEEDQTQGSIDAFLYSSLNMELVCSILNGI